MDCAGPRKFQGWKGAAARFFDDHRGDPNDDAQLRRHAHSRFWRFHFLQHSVRQKHQTSQVAHVSNQRLGSVPILQLQLKQTLRASRMTRSATGARHPSPNSFNLILPPLLQQRSASALVPKGPPPRPHIRPGALERQQLSPVLTSAPVQDADEGQSLADRSAQRPES